MSLENTTSPAFSTPVLVIAFNRPDKVENLLMTLARFGVENLFVSIDGPRSELETVSCAETRSVVERYARNFNLSLVWRDSNLGCGLGVVSALDWFFSHNANGIVLEDDCIPEESMLPTLAKELQSLGENGIGMVTAHNPFINWPTEVLSSYCLIQGWGSSSQIWNQVRREFFKTTFPQMSKSNRAGRSLAESMFWWANSNRARLGGVDTWDGIFSDRMWRLGYKTWVPSENLIHNHGFDHRATHTIDPAGSIFVKVSTLEKTDFDLLLRKEYFRISWRHAFTAPIKVVLDVLRCRKRNQEEILLLDMQNRHTTQP